MLSMRSFESDSVWQEVLLNEVISPDGELLLCLPKK